MADISLSASMRSNLLSLQNTSDLMSQTQERLSTGNKVNSAIDNPSSYYTAQSLNNRASDLNSLLDSMGQAISTIQAADEGIEAITSFVEQAKAVASSALDSKDGSVVSDYMSQFNDIMDQIDALAKDSGYKGVNLINGDNLTVTFNEDRTSSMDIKGQDATTTGLGLTDAAGWATTENVKNVADYSAAATTDLSADTYVVNNNKLYQAKANVATSLGSFDSTKFTDESASVKTYSSSDAYAKDDIVKNADGKYYVVTAATVSAGTAINSTNATEISAYDASSKTTIAANGYVVNGDKVYKANAAVTATLGAFDESKFNLISSDATTVAAAKTADGADIFQPVSKDNTTAINASISALTAATSKLRTMSSELGNNYSIVETREDFTENLVNVLEEGADKLTLADMNEESANMLALQTRQQLAINSLSLASQASQSVLNLF